MNDQEADTILEALEDVTEPLHQRIQQLERAGRLSPEKAQKLATVIKGARSADELSERLSSVFGKDSMADGVLTIVRAACRPLIERILELQKRLEMVEQKGIQYRGVFKQGETYAVGDLITHDGSMWICKIAGNRGRPGSDPTGWQLCVKRGADGRDAKDGR